MLDFPQNNHFAEREDYKMPKVVRLEPKRKDLPSNILRKVPTRPKNSDIRSREYLTSEEVVLLTKAASGIGRHRLRDRMLILLAHRHGLRVSEVVALTWDQVQLQAGRLHVNRLKNGNPATHPIEGDEIRGLRRLKREYSDSPFVFSIERGGPLSRSAVNKIVERAGRRAELELPIHPHMLRHACGFYLANKGVDTRTIQDYLGHRSIQHTVKYTQLAPHKFYGLWN